MQSKSEACATIVTLLLKHSGAWVKRTWRETCYRTQVQWGRTTHQWHNDSPPQKHIHRQREPVLISVRAERHTHLLPVPRSQQLLPVHDQTELSPPSASSFRVSAGFSLSELPRLVLKSWTRSRAPPAAAWSFTRDVTPRPREPRSRSALFSEPILELNYEDVRIICSGLSVVIITVGILNNSAWTALIQRILFIALCPTKFTLIEKDIFFK